MGRTNKTPVHRATEKPGCSGRGKVQSAPGLAIVQIVVPRRPENIPQMSDFFLPQMGDVLTEGVILALFADASGPGFAALGDRRARCCSRERQAPKKPAARERSCSRGSAAWP